MNLVLLGPPGSGKSTVAKPLVERHRLTLIATGQRLRDEMAARSPIGREVEPLLERGEFAPDELMARLIRDVLGKLRPDEGFLMDGYPRTQFQAVTLEQLLADLGRSLTAVVNLVVPDAEVIRRMSGRRTCIIPGEAPWPIHIEDAEAVAQCEARGGTLTQRDDDSPELVRQRLAVYHERTQPLISFYRERGKLLVIDASAPPDEVIERTIAALTPLAQ